MGHAPSNFSINRAVTTRVFKDTIEGAIDLFSKFKAEPGQPVFVEVDSLV